MARKKAFVFERERQAKKKHCTHDCWRRYIYIYIYSKRLACWLWLRCVLAHGHGYGRARRPSPSRTAYASTGVIGCSNSFRPRWRGHPSLDQHRPERTDNRVWLCFYWTTGSMFGCLLDDFVSCLVVAKWKGGSTMNVLVRLPPLASKPRRPWIAHILRLEKIGLPQFNSLVIWQPSLAVQNY